MIWHDGKLTQAVSETPKVENNEKKIKKNRTKANEN